MNVPKLIALSYVSVVQNRITAFWFKGKELALAFGLTLAFSRLGSVLNFFLTQKFEEKYGMQWTLWGGRSVPCIVINSVYTIVFLYPTLFIMLCCPGALLCVLGFMSAIVVSSLDKIGMKQLGLDGAIQEESRKVVLTMTLFLKTKESNTVHTHEWIYTSTLL